MGSSGFILEYVVNNGETAPDWATAKQTALLTDAGEATTPNIDQDDWLSLQSGNWIYVRIVIKGDGITHSDSQPSPVRVGTKTAPTGLLVVDGANTGEVNLSWDKAPTYIAGLDQWNMASGFDLRWAPTSAITMGESSEPLSSSPGATWPATWNRVDIAGGGSGAQGAGMIRDWSATGVTLTGLTAGVEYTFQIRYGFGSAEQFDAGNPNADNRYTDTFTFTPT